MINILIPLIIKTKWKYLSTILDYFTGPILILLIWWLMSASGIINHLLLPSPIEVIKTFGIIFEKEGIFDIFSSLYRIILGFIIGALPGIPLGILIGINKSNYKKFEFIIEFFKSLPPLAVFPIFLLFFGIGDVSKIILAAFASFWLILVNTISGVWLVPETEIFTGKVFRASAFQIIIYIIFPGSLPSIFSGLRLSLSFSVIVTIVAEMFVGNQFGLGQKIFDSYMTYNIPQMYAYIIIVGFAGYLLNKILLILEQKIVHWTGK